MRAIVNNLTGVLLLLLPLAGWSLPAEPCQDGTPLEVSGTVTDAYTGEAVGYASVGIVGTPVGTSANSEGHFSLTIPVQYGRDSLLVSLLGYAPYRIAIRAISTQQPLTVRLARKTVALREVVVGYRRLTTRDILRRAIDSLPANYPAAPYSAAGFYRETRYQDGQYRSLLEAAVRLYNVHNRPFTGINISRLVAIEQIRGSREVEKYAFPDHNALYTLLYAEPVRHRLFHRLDKKVPREYPSLFDTLNGRPVCVILVANSPYLTRLFIDTETFGVARVEDYKNFSGPADGKLSNHFWLRFIRVVNGYAYRAEKYYLNYMSSHAEGETRNLVTGKAQSVGFLFKELFIHTPVGGDAQPVSPAENMPRYPPLYHQRQPYHPAFWRDFWGIARHPIAPQIEADLGGKKTLEEQFAHWGGAASQPSQ